MQGHVIRCLREVQVSTWLQQRRPDLIVLASSNSDALCRTLKFRRATSGIPVIQVASSRGSTFRVEPDAVLEDPTCTVALAEAITSALAARANRLREGILAEVCAWLPSSSDQLEQLNEFLPGWLADCGLTPFQVKQVNLATRELGANAIEWGHRGDPSRLVEVTCRLDDEKVCILVRDTGPGFDRGDLPHAARPGDPLSHLSIRAAQKLREGGFGILMMRGLVDHLCYNEAGNEGLLVKYLPARAVVTFSDVGDAVASPVGP